MTIGSPIHRCFRAATLYHARAAWGLCMADGNNDLRAGIVAAQSGNKYEARACLLRAVSVEPRNEIAWLWLSSVVPTTEQALKCIDHLLVINPANTHALQAKETLQVRMLLEEASLLEKRRTGQLHPTIHRASLRLGDLLVDQGVLTRAQLDAALGEQQRLARLGRPTRLGEVLLSGKHIRREQLAAALRAQIDALKYQESSAVTSLGQYLVKRNYLSSDELAHALSLQSKDARGSTMPKLGDVLVRYGYLTQSQLDRALTDQSHEYELQFR